MTLLIMWTYIIGDTMVNYQEIENEISKNFTMKKLDVKSDHFTSVLYIKNQFLFWNRDFLVTFLHEKYTGEARENVLNEIQQLNDKMPRQNNSYNCLCVCECGGRFPKDGVWFQGDWMSVFLLYKGNRTKFDTGFYFGGAGKIKKCAALIQQHIETKR